jgi:hypothetical protein
MVSTKGFSLLNNDGSKVVFVGGYNLDDLKSYADSVEFR